MNDILFGNNNMAVIKRLSKRYFKKNKVRNNMSSLSTAILLSRPDVGGLLALRQIRPDTALKLIMLTPFSRN